MARSLGIIDLYLMKIVLYVKLIDQYLTNINCLWVDMVKAKYDTINL